MIEQREMVVFGKVGQCWIPLREVQCTRCGTTIGTLRDHASIQEFVSSGLCQSCQDTGE